VNFNRSSRLSPMLRDLRRFPLALFLLPVIVLVFAGCDLRRVVVNHPFDPHRLETLIPGKSSLEDVVQILGAPDDISDKPDGMVPRYRYANSRTMRVNFG
jgi:hypothetical protein